MMIYFLLRFRERYYLSFFSTDRTLRFYQEIFIGGGRNDEKICLTMLSA